MKGSVEQLLHHINVSKFKFSSIGENNLNLFNSNSAELFVNKRLAGIVGEINQTVLKKYDIELPVIVATIDLTTLSEIEISFPYYSPVSPYPVVKRDLAFVVENAHSVKDIKQTIVSKASPLLKSVIVFDVYTGKNIDAGKRSLGFELTFSSMERTLTDQEIEADIDMIVKSLEKNFQAELRK